jgi:hypothetical protein
MIRNKILRELYREEREAGSLHCGKGDVTGRLKYVNLYIAMGQNTFTVPLCCLCLPQETSGSLGCRKPVKTILWQNEGINSSQP